MGKRTHDEVEGEGGETTVRIQLRVDRHPLLFPSPFFLPLFVSPSCSSSSSFSFLMGDARWSCPLIVRASIAHFNFVGWWLLAGPPLCHSPQNTEPPYQQRLHVRLCIYLTASPDATTALASFFFWLRSTTIINTVQSAPMLFVYNKIQDGGAVKDESTMTREERRKMFWEQRKAAAEERAAKKAGVEYDPAAEAAAREAAAAGTAGKGSGGGEDGEADGAGAEPAEVSAAAQAILVRIAEQGKAIAALKQNKGTKEEIAAGFELFHAMRAEYKDETGEEPPKKKRQRGKKGT